MIRHDQARDNFALYDMPLHDLRHVGFRFHAIPYAFRVNDDTRPFGAVVEAAGFIRPDNVFQIESLGFLLEMCVQPL